MTNHQIKNSRPANALISVVLPVFNESAILDELTDQIVQTMQAVGNRFEVVYVNDGSRDGSAELLDDIASRYPQVRVVHLSRNFGHQAAVQAGLEQAQGDALIVMDSDLQDDPRALKTFIDHWRDGYDVVYAVRTDRKENVVKRGLFSLFYRILERVSDIPIPRDAGNFGLIDRQVADLINKIEDRDRYYPGLRSWVGFRQIGIPVERAARHDDNPRVSFWQLVKLAKAAVFSFSSVPIGFFYAVAIVSLLVCTGTSAFAIFHRLFSGLAISGWTSLIITSSFFGALNAAGLAVIGEYVVRIYDQVRARPQYVVNQQGSSSTPADTQNDSILEWVDQAITDQKDSVELMEHSATRGR
ncbi:MAG: glycosyltransferase family 2 protein [Planctomycetaceae bacterium]|nr:glycosyltransferase family 2 protein [Planctomycetaceae bacterium]